VEGPGRCWRTGPGEARSPVCHQRAETPSIIKAPTMCDHSSFTGPDASAAIPAADDDRTPTRDARGVHPYELAAHLDTEELLGGVGEALSTSDVCRVSLADANAHPSWPGASTRRPLADAWRLGCEVARIRATALDAAIGRRMAGWEEAPHA
jgi:hypothetical protein